MKEVFRIAFDKAGAKPVGRSCNAFVRAILRDHPELRGETVYFPEQGKFGYTAIIGDLVFKAARAEVHPDHRDAGIVEIYRRSLERERKILRHLKGKGLPVPEFRGEGNDPLYFCMSRCTGVRLDQEALDKMTRQERIRIAKDLAGFMAGLSKAVSAEAAADMGFERSSEERELRPDKLKDFLNDRAVAKVLGDNLDFCRRMQAEFNKRHEEDYRNDAKVFSHGDLHPGNILYNPATRRIDGGAGCVIDLGLCHYVRPVRECAALMGSYKNDDFIAAICNEYSKLMNNTFSLGDVKALRCALLVSAVKHCLESDDEKWRERLPGLLKEIAEIKASLVPRTNSRRPAKARGNNHT